MDRRDLQILNAPILRAAPFVLIFCLLLVIYWGSFHTGWQMDDRPNIIDNPGLRIDNLMPESLWGTFFANQGKTPKLFRPLPCLTLALNWYAGRDNPFGYHVVNLGFHMVTAWVLYLLMMQLLHIYKNSIIEDHTAVENIALLAVVLWAVNPIHTQAVTYIVQRMAIMATLFYVLGMLYFLKARTTAAASLRWRYGAVCFLCFVCGLGSKENAVLLPVSLALMEWIFFRHGSLAFLARPKVLISGTGILILGLLAVHATIGLPVYILTGYEERPFTMTERLLTQPRIILGYLSQIFFPLPNRLSIAHDITLSNSFLQPWTTLPALILVLVMIIGAMAAAKRYPLSSFAVLFYFLNHAVESTILPLELIFEHRNYLPSLFLFLPVATGFYALVMRLPRPSIRHIGPVGMMIVIITGLGFFTHTRNQAWATSETLWRDAALKAPGSSRPLVTLAIQLAWRDNPTPADYRHALVLFQRSLNLTPNRTMEQADILGNMASVYFNQGNNEKAIEIYLRALSINPKFFKNRSDLIKPLIMAGRLEMAKEQAKYLIVARPDNPDYLNLLGFILLWQNEPEEALVCFQNSMKKNRTQKKLPMFLGLTLTQAGYLDRGRWFLNQAVQNTHGDPIPVFAMIENRIRAGELNSANGYAKKLLEILPASGIVQSLNSLPGNRRFVPISVDLIRPVLLDVMCPQN